MDRIQRKRKKNWSIPPNTLCVTRGTLFGNPFKLEGPEDICRTMAVNEFREWIMKDEQTVLRAKFLLRCERDNIKHLACWCTLPNECHADVWIEIWNNRAPSDERPIVKGTENE